MEGALKLARQVSISFGFLVVILTISKFYPVLG